MDERENNIINGTNQPNDYIFSDTSQNEVSDEHATFIAPIKEKIPFIDITETQIPIVGPAEADIPVGRLVEADIPVGRLIEEDIPVGRTVEAEGPYGKIPSPVSHPVNLSSKTQPIQTNKKSKKKKGKYATKEEIYKNPKSRWIVLLIGFVLSAASAMLAITPLLMLFVPGWAALSGDKSLIEVAKPLNITAAVVGFVSIVLGVAGANTNKFLARLVFLLGIFAFFAGMVMLVFIVPITKFLGYN